eukprot:TRINITY_DN936_c0_g1_i14.p1 TRINITY_DN936_c0_g1~~TRINITY_DN936_c0_g1_i14.p1  ORF type:complete len:1870 (-),score=505.12 TRINITY_DN936_c0_g1_i14:2049-7658(-)
MMDGNVDAGSEQKLGHDGVHNSKRRRRLAAVQLLAVTLKNAMVKCRHPVLTLLEVVSPLVLIVVLVIGYYKAGNDHYDAKTYLNETMPLIPLDHLEEYKDKFPVCVNPSQLMFTPTPPPDGFVCFTLSDALDYNGPLPVLNFDQYASLHYTLLALTGNRSLDDLPEKTHDKIEEFGNLYELGKLYFAAYTAGDDNTLAQIELFADYMHKTFHFFDDFFGGVYASQDAVLDEVDDNPGRVWAVLVFKQFDIDGGNIDYNIRCNWTKVPWTDTSVDEYLQGMDQEYIKYWRSGFLSLQLAVADYIGNATSMLGGTMFTAPFPIHEYKDNMFFEYLGPLFGMVVVLSILYPSSRLVKEIVEDKESCVKETLRMVGTPVWVFTTSWAIVYLVIFLGVAILATILECATFLPKSNWLLVFLLNYFFLCSIIALSSVFASFFSNPKIAGVVSPLALFACVIPRFLFMTASEGQLVGAKILSSVLSPTAFAFGAAVLSRREGAAQGVTFSNMTGGGSSGYPFIVVLIMLLLDTAFYSGLAWYLERVVPSQYGVRYPPWFLFTPQYWCGHSCGKPKGLFAKDEVEFGDNVEPVGSGFVGNATIRIRELSKTYSNGRKAVAGLSLTMYRDQICCLLGHNGAGKTTTISMLTGLTTITSGDCYINNRSVRTDMAEIRQTLGICPQRNVIVPVLTVREHLLMVGLLKGVGLLKVRKAADEMIELVGLTPKRGTLAGHLSGGMKRKLCLAMALIGDSAIVFLDEPTSGMDPYSRRTTWDLLAKCKMGRTIVLTTHFMDEADLLGDRIAIMSAGKLQCVGSSLFLKTRYGVGYTLTVERGAEFDQANMLSLIHSHVPDAVEVNATQRELSYSLPLAAIASFAKLFLRLDEKKEAGSGIIAYGVSMTTLEQVFLRLAAESHGPEELPRKRRFAFIRDFLLGHVCCCFNRHKPVDPTTIEGVDAENTVCEPAQESLRESCADSCGNSVTESAGNAEEWDRKYNSANVLIQFWEMFYKRFVCARRDFKALCFQILVPVIVVALVLLMLKIKIDPAGPKMPLDAKTLDWQHDKDSDKEPTLMFYVANSFAKELLPYLEDPYVTQTPKYVNDSLALSDVLLAQAHSHDNNRFGALAFDDRLHYYNPNATFPVVATVLHNITAYHAAPIFLHLIHRAAYIHSLITRGLLPPGSNSSDITFKANSKPLPLSDIEEASFEGILGALAAMFLLVPFSFVAANFVVFLVKERATKAKHLLKTSGVNLFSFWAANLLWDTIMFFVIVACTMIVFGAYHNKAFVGSAEKFFATALLLFFYGIAAFTISYVLHFAFSSGMAAQLGIAAVTFVLGFGLVLTSFILDNLPSTQDGNKIAKRFYRIAPPFLFGEGLINLNNLDANNKAYDEDKSPFAWDVTGRSLLFMMVEAAACMVITLFIDCGLAKFLLGYIYRPLDHFYNFARSRVARCWLRAFARVGCCLAKKTASTKDISLADSGRKGSAVSHIVASGGNDSLKDDDVLDEKRRVKVQIAALRSGEIKADGMDAVVLSKLRKVFPPTAGAPAKVAVNNLYLGVPTGECFGFLGTNGAGKTTTLSILTHDLDPTSGDAYIGGHNVVKDFSRTRKNVGYCPQFDPLLDKMTGREHLTMYGRLKGIPRRNIHVAVGQLLQYTGLAPHADVLAEAYSGGNKRKLSLAIAMIGAPNVLFLDEPSSGMDPVARRSMWEVIRAASHTKSIVITSHSMEETEALCGRVGIMVNGSFQCLGSIQHLKDKFGGGYLVELKTREDKLEEVKQFMTGKFDCELTEEHNGRLKYVLPKEGTLGLATIFGTIEEAKEALGISDYAVSQPTLEQIFVAIARRQEEHNADVDLTADSNSSSSSDEDDCRKGKELDEEAL